MSYEIIVRPEAAREVQEAFDWYQEKTEGLEFLRAADACLAGIQRNPFASPMMYQEIRRALLRKFPYILFLHCQRRTNHRAGVLSCTAKSDRLDAARLSQARPSNNSLQPTS